MRAKLPHTSDKLDRQGVGLHYDIYGEGPDTILFVPTWSLVHSRVWKAQVPYLSDRFRVITFDPRGNGKSDRPDHPDDYMLSKTVEDVVAVMKETGTDQAILVGMR